MQPQRFVMLGINACSYNTVLEVTSQFILKNWWVSRKQQPSIPDTFDYLVKEIHKKFMLSYIRGDAIHALLDLRKDP
jgi:hypothetical protein